MVRTYVVYVENITAIHSDDDVQGNVRSRYAPELYWAHSERIMGFS